jgi:hypothetical protein
VAVGSSGPAGSGVATGSSGVHRHAEPYLRSAARTRRRGDDTTTRRQKDVAPRHSGSTVGHGSSGIHGHAETYPRSAARAWGRGDDTTSERCSVKAFGSDCGALARAVFTVTLKRTRGPLRGHGDETTARRQKDVASGNSPARCGPGVFRPRAYCPVESRGRPKRLRRHRAPIRYSAESDLMKNDLSATAIDARVAPSSWLVARRLNVVVGAITVVTPSSLRK